MLGLSVIINLGMVQNFMRDLVITNSRLHTDLMENGLECCDVIFELEYG